MTPLAALLLAACASGLDNIAAEPEPANYREAAHEYLRTSLVDPYSVRDAQISKPRWQPAWVLTPSPGWMVCFRGNARNRMGGYLGLSDRVLVFRGGRVAESLPEGPYTNSLCAGESFEPFTIRA
jgi:hypothetical protein